MTRRLLASLKLLIALLSVAVLVLAAGIWQRQTLSSDSRNLAVSVIQTVVSSGEATALLEHAHEELIAMWSAESLGNYLYEIPLSFSRSDATAFVDLRRVDGDWRFTRFRVDAPLLYN